MIVNEKSRNRQLNRKITGEWSTPKELFRELNKEFNFTLDACAMTHNAKCKKFFSSAIDGLKQSWAGETVYCCPPSGVTEFKRWTQKAKAEAQKANTTVVMLLPVSTDSQWFKDNIYHQRGVTIRFLPSRVHFTNSITPSWVEGNREETYGSMRPSMLVIFSGSNAPFCVE